MISAASLARSKTQDPRGSSAFLQRCTATEECSECKAARLQRSALDTHSLGHIHPAVDRAAQGAGQPLPAGIRSFMEPRFGRDFGGVRVHTDVASTVAARAVGARAYTIGQDIYFGAGRYNLSSADGRRLLAHELTHTIQQARPGVRRAREEPIDEPDAPLEVEADRVGGAVFSGVPAPIASAAEGGSVLQRDADTASGEMVAKDGRRFKVTRTLEDQKCKKEPAPEKTPKDQIFFVDKDTRTIGFQYRYCYDKLEVMGESSAQSVITYNNFRSIASRAAASPKAAIDPAQVLADLATGEVKGRFEVTIGGRMHLELLGGVDLQPGDARTYDVEGNWVYTGDTWSFQIISGLTIDQANALSRRDIRFRAVFERGNFQVGAGVENVAPPVGAGTTSVTGSISYRTGETTGFTLSGTGTTGGGVSVMLMFGTLAPKPTVKDVRCFTCNCPAPIAHYVCELVVEPTRPGGEPVLAPPETKQLHYPYWESKPRDLDAYSHELAPIVSLIQHGYTVKEIVGYASPEGRLKTINIPLAQARADDARQRLLDALQEPRPLPAAVGLGELYGEEGNRELSDANLTDQLKRTLVPLSDDARLELLGINVTPESRAGALAQVDAFLKGQVDGKQLTTRARWEKIFPYLRRVDVTLQPPAPPKAAPPPKPTPAPPSACPPEVKDWAATNMPPIPAGREVPPEGGACDAPSGSLGGSR